MARKYKSPDRFIQPDPRFQHVLVTKFINCVMQDGKKLVAQRIFYEAMAEIERRVKKDPLDVFLNAVQNVKPLLEVKGRRVGGATYQVPVEVMRKRQTALAIRWILSSARSRKGRPMHLRLADELISAYRREGGAMTKRENIHKMAEANKAFAHFAW